MLEDKFKLSKTNIFLIILNVILVIFVILVSVQLVISLNDSSHQIPELSTTQGKSSTRVQDATSTTSTETTTTTTKKLGNNQSPYYDIDLNSILKEELVTKENLNESEKRELGAEMFKVLEGIFEGSDDDLINVTHLLTVAKDGEIDKRVVNGHQYGIIYGGKDFLSNIFENSVISMLTLYKYDGVPAIYEENKNYYKLGSTTGKKRYEVTETGVTGVSGTTYEFIYKVIYYNTDYKETGSKLEYKSASIRIKYKSEKKRWLVSSLEFPNLEVRA